MFTGPIRGEGAVRGRIVQAVLRPERTGQYRPGGRFMKRFFIVAALLCLCAQSAPATDISGAAAPPGKLTCVGSDTMRVLMQEWGKAFLADHPDVILTHQNHGSGTALPALIEGRCNLAAMSRPMSNAEISRFETQFGHRPTGIKVALDALAVYVNKDNPLRGLTLKQLDGIFSASRKCGGRRLDDWGELVFGSFEGQAIVPVGRDELSGTHELFREKAMCGGAFRKGLRVAKDSEDVITFVASDKYAIGYSGIGYRTGEVRALAIARNADSGYYAYHVKEFRNDPDLKKRYAYVYRGKYPLSRFLYIYLDKAPGRILPRHLDQFLRFVLSAKGQNIVHKVGFIPMTEKMTARERKKLSADSLPSWWPL